MQHDATQFTCGKLRRAFLCSLLQEDKITGYAGDLHLHAVAIECRICDAGVTFEVSRVFNSAVRRWALGLVSSGQGQV